MQRLGVFVNKDSRMEGNPVLPTIVVRGFGSFPALHLPYIYESMIQGTALGVLTPVPISKEVVEVVIQSCSKVVLSRSCGASKCSASPHPLVSSPYLEPPVLNPRSPPSPAPRLRPPPCHEEQTDPAWEDVQLGTERFRVPEPEVAWHKSVLRTVHAHIVGWWWWSASCRGESWSRGDSGCRACM